MRKSVLLLTVLFAASVPSVADAAKAKRAKAKPAATVEKEVDPNAAGKLVLTEGLPGLLMPTALKPLWFHYREQQKQEAAAAAAATKGKKKARR